MLPLVGQDEVHVAEEERGQRLLGLGLDQLAAKVGSISGERLHGGHGKVKGNRLERRDASASRNAARGCRQVGLRELGALEERVGVADEDERGVGQPDAPPCPLQQRHPRLALEHGQLLGDRRRGELEGLRHGGDRAPRVELVQEPQSMEIEHSQVNLPNSA